MGRPLKTTKGPGIDTGYTNLYGVVGGNTGTVGTQIQCRVKIATNAEENGWIIRNKSARKFLVSGTNSLTALVAGLTYRINAVGNTNWNAQGVLEPPTVGTIFTATSSLANTGTGSVNAVGICVLADLPNASLTADTMTITITDAGATTHRLAKLNDTFGITFAGTGFILTFGAASATPPNGSPYQIATVASL